MKSEWQYSTQHNSPCKVIEEQTLWGQTVCRVWLPDSGLMVSVPRASLRPVPDKLQPETEAAHISYLAAATKVAEVLENAGSMHDGHILLAPMESNVIPLPHQIKALSRAVSGDRVRYLLADEVGLGKTIEAGLIIRELKLRGLIRRTLVVAPKGLATQWVSEMETHFNEPFQLILGEDIELLDRLKPQGSGAGSAWDGYNQVVVSLDSIKPMERRRGWTPERIRAYNRKRFDEIITAGWDLIVVDEAHRLGGSTDQVARYKLGRGLAGAAPYFLLLSATPHQGKTDAFHRLISLLDENAFPDPESVTRERVAPYVIRTEKRRAIDAKGQPLFKPRITQTAAVAWGSGHELQEQLYEAVTAYVREGYNQALQQKKRHIGFLMILMQRLVVSSTRAIRTTLERRLNALDDGHAQLSFHLEELENDPQNAELLADLYDLDGQELLEELLNAQANAVVSEKEQVRLLHQMAARCEQAGPDAKAEALLDWIYRLQAEENEPDIKLLIFTEFVPTQQMLQEFLTDRGISVVTLNGSMNMDERRQVQASFKETHRVLVSTDAGGEGLNLQFAHVIVNYDIPWNPMRLEQRIGRVDRIGQPKTVRAINFVFENSVEFRVREVLEEKLAVIFEEFGIDKTGDVLDSAQAGELFDDIFAQAILNPDDIEKTVDGTVQELRKEIGRYREESPVFGVADEPDPEAAERIRTHPFRHWVESMTVSYLQSHAGSAVRTRSWWDLSWPDGETLRKCVFSSAEAERLKGATLLNLANPKIKALTQNLPVFTESRRLATMQIPKLPQTVSGIWGLFEIRLSTAETTAREAVRIPSSRRGFVSVFLSKDGALYLPTARYIWENLQRDEIEISGHADAAETSEAYRLLCKAAEEAGQEIFERLHDMHKQALEREEERGRTFFESQRKNIVRIGLPEVKQYRLSKCDAEEKQWRESMAAHRNIVPDIRPLIMLGIN
ncbi:MAG: DEAD/DEAH box helicase [Balneolales bacterium]|nr:DEAD/DEAH box helicase [Balneolales bacterium]